MRHMSTGKTLQINSTSSAETEALAAKIARRLKGGELIELASDLGGGKTTFVRGLVGALGSPDKVASPTFTIGKVYETDKFEVHHFDFYRLQDAGLAVYELQDLLGDPGIVIVMEWAQIVSHVLPKERLSITFTRTGDDSRTLTLAYSESMAYLVEDL
jgi:tRNA threonylcarbamoyladenosine biosynthesis protein TsaE